jgi:hypothetical protein
MIPLYSFTRDLSLLLHRREIKKLKREHEARGWSVARRRNDKKQRKTRKRNEEMNKDHGNDEGIWR